MSDSFVTDVGDKRLGYPPLISITIFSLCTSGWMSSPFINAASFGARSQFDLLNLSSKYPPAHIAVISQYCDIVPLAELREAVVIERPAILQCAHFRI
ncbi:hypothetical protein [Tardiphaga sp. 285_C5_N1_2]|uniref:hypothetical protein n=1 Tax=Tardiphaga sp. 285_C5_N1_2 TaxID=3240775 RepID=UPI003F8B0445